MRGKIMKRRLVALVIAVLGFGSPSLFAFGGADIPRDEEIKENVVDQLTWDDRVDASEVKVEVEFGRVTLSGTVPSSFTEQAVIDDAWSVDGVVAVENNLEIEPYVVSAAEDPLASRVKGALLVDSGVDSSEITVSSMDGQVTLNGTVEALWQKVRAEEIASGVSGVLGVQPVPSDSEIGKAVRDQLRWDNQVDATDVTVEVADGQVTLIGTVPSYSAKLAAESDALMIRGVVSVENDLIVEPVEPITNDMFLSTRAENVLEWNPDVHVENLAIEVIAGVATVEGQVDALWEKDKAEQLVMDIEGTIGVINKIAVVPTESIVDEIIAEDIVEAIDRNIHVNVDNVTVNVDQGTVTLTGEVGNITAMSAAFDAALNTAGVRAVINDIEVSS